MNRRESNSRLFSSLLGFFLLLICVCVAGIYIWLEKDITVTIDSQTYSYSTHCRTVAELLDQEKLAYYPQDLIDPPLYTPLEHGSEINIIRSFETTITADGQEYIIRSIPLTVAEALAKAQVSLGEMDEISLPLNTRLIEAQAIYISRISRELITVQETLAAVTERRDDHKLEKGVSRVVQDGADGLKEDIIQLTFRDGAEIDREVVDTKVIEPVQNRIIAQGTISTASRGGVKFKFKETRVVTATAYCEPGGHTSTGKTPQVGMIAVDPKIIPMHSRVYVEGYGFAVAEDVGGAIKGDKIDIYLESEEACMRWGVKTVKIYLLE